ncbi:WxL protein peptidoglycan domain-containing protein [Bombilactobacillus thymidiniphilus]|uniref:DUF916 and DUF3324 domain-containing protein n=1 Tax=Bombilactobacillus thymidiniphilus TaxID=2923363 RepID=A0ABY4PCC8_9LACO|nr:DUF916 domain-containing protein [Bombilactobacillus thymidiniphilus]UQS83214.1 DUF916 and DUF3324 domain-containing protein [Bombilactobacillus thymidiniphilus]
MQFPNINIKRRCFFVLSCISLVIFTVCHFNTPVQAAGGTFSVIPEATEHQVGSVKGGWYLAVQPQQTYTLKFKLINLTNKENIITVTPTVAQTSNDLQIGIDNPKNNPGPGAQNDLRKLVSKQKVTVPPNGSTDSSVILTTPQRPIKGTLMGGLFFKSESDVAHQTSRVKKNHNQSVISTAAISYGLNIFQKRAALAPKFSVAAPTLKSENGKVMLRTPISNRQNYPLLRASARVKVEQAPKSRLNFQKTFPNVEFAGNSKLNWLVPWGKGPLVAGTYKVTYVLKNKKRHYVFHRNLIVTKKQAQEFNKLLPKKDPDYKVIIIVVLVLLLLVMVLLTCLVYYYGGNQAFKGGEK